MRTPVAVGLLGVSAVGILSLGLSMAWGGEPDADFGGAVLATATGTAATTTTTGEGATAPATGSPTGTPTSALPTDTRTLVTVPPAGAVELDDDEGDDQDDDGDDDSDGEDHSGRDHDEDE